MGRCQHVLIIAFAAQGHLNPALQFAERLLKIGVQVTFSTTAFATSCITNAPQGLTFASFSDGYDDGIKPKGLSWKDYMPRFIGEASKSLRTVISSGAESGRPVACLVYTISLSWAADVARESRVPSAILWIQPATVLVIYHCFFHEYEDDVKNLDGNDSIQFPGLPLLKTRDIPSFMLPSSEPIYNAVLGAFESQIESLDHEEKPYVLVNTFEALEPEALKAIENYKMIAIGPLTSSDTSFGGDLMQKSNDCKEWLDSKDAASVIYVSFGSMVSVPKKQLEEIAGALLRTRRPFLWVVRGDKDENEEVKLSCLEEMEQIGKIVEWCSQTDVLVHPSLGCFVSHCGWNSTLESVVCGVPVVAFPIWSDQGTNAKLVEDVWRTGVRVRPGEDGTVERDEIVRCIEMVMDDGEEGCELRNSVKKWKGLAGEAVQSRGSSDKNLRAFLEEVGEDLITNSS